MAHTTNSMEHVLARMEKDGIRGKLLFGCFADKNIDGMVEALAKSIARSGTFTEIYLTRPGDFRQSDLARVEKAFRAQGLAVVADEDFEKFIPKVLALADAEKKPLSVLGSAHLVGEVKRRLELAV